MTYISYVIYDEAGNISQVRTEEEAIYTQRLADGDRIIPVSKVIDGQYFKVDVNTKEIIEKTDEELAELNIERVPFIDLAKIAGK